MRKITIKDEIVLLRENLTRYILNKIIDPNNKLYTSNFLPNINVNTIYVDAKTEFERRGLYL